MNRSRLIASRERKAHAELLHFDFGVPVRVYHGWTEDTHESLSCAVELKSAVGCRMVTFRAVFQPNSDSVKALEVREDQPVAEAS